MDFGKCVLCCLCNWRTCMHYICNEFWKVAFICLAAHRWEKCTHYLSHDFWTLNVLHSSTIRNFMCYIAWSFWSNFTTPEWDDLGILFKVCLSVYLSVNFDLTYSFWWVLIRVHIWYAYSLGDSVIPDDQELGTLCFKNTSLRFVYLWYNLTAVITVNLCWIIL